MFPGFFRVLFQSVMSVPSIPSVPSVPSIPSVRPSECTILFLNRSRVRNLFNHTSKAILIILNIYRFCFSEIMLLWFLVFYRGKGGHQLIRSESRALELKINLEEWTRLQNPFCLCSARKNSGRQTSCTRLRGPPHTSCFFRQSSTRGQGFKLSLLIFYIFMFNVIYKYPK